MPRTSPTTTALFALTVAAAGVYFYISRTKKHIMKTMTDNTDANEDEVIMPTTNATDRSATDTETTITKSDNYETTGSHATADIELNAMDIATHKEVSEL